MKSRSQARKLYELYYAQNWLVMIEPKVTELIDLCSTDEEKVLLFDLLKNFEFVDYGKFQTLLEMMAMRICQELNLDVNTTQITTTAFDNEPDSSQMLLQTLKSKFPKLGFNKVRTRSKGMDTIKYIDECPTIVMVEEFSGTGNTIISRYNNLQQNAQSKLNQIGSDKELRIIVCLMVAMNRAAQKIRDAGIEVYVEKELCAGITQRYPEGEAEEKVVLMRSIEAKLDQEKMDAFPTLGYGSAEALYSLQNSNAPNNNFPVLWWRHLSDGSAFTPILDRQEPKYHD